MGNDFSVLSDLRNLGPGKAIRLAQRLAVTLAKVNNGQGDSTRRSFLAALRLLTNRCYIDGILFRLAGISRLFIEDY